MLNKYNVDDPIHGGSSVMNTPVKKRPKVKDELKNLLKQSGPINGKLTL